MSDKNWSRIWNEESHTYEYVERLNYASHTLTRTELLSAIYLYLNSIRGIKIDPSCGQLSQNPFPSEDFLLETWDEQPTHPSDEGGRDA